MSYVLAVDVGTSFTAAAIVRIDRNGVPEILPLGLRGSAVPSVVYYPPEGPVLLGEAAERRGLDSPERVVREFKRRVGDAVPICVGTLSLPAEDVFATMARWVADRAEDREGSPPSEIVLSHPASWGGHRTALILDALAAKGLSRVTLITEPEAAALHYASQVRVEDGSIIGVYDLGGGTFDTAVLRKAAAGRFDLLGKPEGIEGLGGADFDAAVFGHVVEHAGAALAAADPEMPGTLAALARLRRECVEAKEALSSDTEASISVLLPGTQQQIRLVRSEFEAMIEAPVRETVDALEHSLQDMGLDAGDLSAVVLIGGSSRIPLVAQLISQQLDRPIAVDADPKSSICLGAAAAALRALPVAHGQAADGEAGPGPVPVPVPGEKTVVPGLHSAGRTGWRRKPATLAGAVPGAVAAGHRQHDVRPGTHDGAKSGAHAPKPGARMAAAAAAAALFTVLTATAAQSPEGLGPLSAMFVPPAADAAKDSGAPGAAAVGTGETFGATTGATADGIEATAQKAAGKLPSTAGIDIAASATSQPPSGTSGQGSPAGGTSAGPAASNTMPQTTDPLPAGTADSTAVPTDSGATPATSAPADPVPQPTPQPTPVPSTQETSTAGPTPEPTLEPTTAAPTPEPTLESTPGPTPEPTADPSAPVPTTETTITADPTLLTEPAV
jgi:actin-like ATPase involved in cell morphogenesis